MRQILTRDINIIKNITFTSFFLIMLLVNNLFAIYPLISFSLIVDVLH